jgi:hypothetical protein
LVWSMSDRQSTSGWPVISIRSPERSELLNEYANRDIAVHVPILFNVAN